MNKYGVRENWKTESNKGKEVKVGDCFECLSPPLKAAVLKGRSISACPAASLPHDKDCLKPPSLHKACPGLPGCLFRWSR